MLSDQNKRAYTPYEYSNSFDDDEFMGGYQRFLDTGIYALDYENNGSGIQRSGGVVLIEGQPCSGKSCLAYQCALFTADRHPHELVHVFTGENKDHARNRLQSLTACVELSSIDNDMLTGEEYRRIESSPIPKNIAYHPLSTFRDITDLMRHNLDNQIDYDRYEGTPNTALIVLDDIRGLLRNATGPHVAALTLESVLVRLDRLARETSCTIVITVPTMSVITVSDDGVEVECADNATMNRYTRLQIAESTDEDNRKYLLYFTQGSTSPHILCIDNGFRWFRDIDRDAKGHYWFASLIAEPKSISRKLQLLAIAYKHPELRPLLGGLMFNNEEFDKVRAVMSITTADEELDCLPEQDKNILTDVYEQIIPYQYRAYSDSTKTGVQGISRFIREKFVYLAIEQREWQTASLGQRFLTGLRRIIEVPALVDDDIFSDIKNPFRAGYNPTGYSPSASSALQYDEVMLEIETELMHLANRATSYANNYYIVQAMEFLDIQSHTDSLSEQSLGNIKSELNAEFEDIVNHSIIGTGERG